MVHFVELKDYFIFVIWSRVLVVPKKVFFLKGLYMISQVTLHILIHAERIKLDRNISKCEKKMAKIKMKESH